MNHSIESTCANGRASGSVGSIDLTALVTYIQDLAKPFNSSVEGRIKRLN